MADPFHAKKTALVIFGVSGDLSKRKLLPALFRLYLEGELPKKVQIFGISRNDLDINDLRSSIEPLAKTVPYEVLRQTLVEQFLKLITVVTMDSAKPGDYGELRKLLVARKLHTRLFYLSIPPLIALPVIEALHVSGVSERANAEHRLMLEKPFGFDLQSASDFVSSVEKFFSEEQLFRIDHYMAKETARNIAYFRFRNPIIRRVWCAEMIQSISVTASEAIGIEGRVQFYEQTGALRDVLQSHLLSLAALVTMDEPMSSSQRDVQHARLTALKRLRLSSQDVGSVSYRAQYETYGDEVGGTHPNSETFVHIRTTISSGPMKGVLVDLQTGKALKEKQTEIVVTFKTEGIEPNRVVLEIQPQESIHIMLDAKKPGLHKDNESFTLTYTYDNPAGAKPDGYESVLLDAFRGDRTNFVTNMELLETWRIVEPVIKLWSLQKEPQQVYKNGSSIEEVLTSKDKDTAANTKKRRIGK